jgi:hypothetical protein
MHSIRVVGLTVLFCAISTSPAHFVQLALRAAHKDKSNIRDFLVDVEVDTEDTPWPVRLLFDTGSGVTWGNHDEVSSRQRIPLHGYRFGRGDAVFPHRQSLVYGGGAVQVTITVGVKERIRLKGMKRRLKLDFFVNQHAAIGMEPSFGMVGVLGASPRAPFTQALGPFYFVPGQRTMLLMTGHFRHNRMCYKPLVRVPLSRTGRRMATWSLDGVVSVGGVASRKLELLFDTGNAHIELPSSVWNQFVSLIHQAGSSVEQNVPTSYIINNCDMSRLPSVTISLPGFRHTILPHQYAEQYSRRKCSFFGRPIGERDRVIIGTQLLTHVVSWWDPIRSEMGFCRPRRQ